MNQTHTHPILIPVIVFETTFGRTQWLTLVRRWKKKSLTHGTSNRSHRTLWPHFERLAYRSIDRDGIACRLSWPGSSWNRYHSRPNCKIPTRLVVQVWPEVHLVREFFTQHVVGKEPRIMTDKGGGSRRNGTIIQTEGTGHSNLVDNAGEFTSHLHRCLSRKRQKNMETMWIDKQRCLLVVPCDFHGQYSIGCNISGNWVGWQNISANARKLQDYTRCHRAKSR